MPVVEINQTVVHDVLFLNNNNKKVQEKLCVEPFNDHEDLQYAIFYGKGVKRQKIMGKEVAESLKVAIKSDPECAVERVNKKECFRCGVGISQQTI